MLIGGWLAACTEPAPRQAAMETVDEEPAIMTVRGRISPDSMGKTLSHEHILVDFVGADEVGPHRYEVDSAIAVALPHLWELEELGVETLVECTPAYLGRDVGMLKRLSELTGLNLLTNTGYYGARENKFLPSHAFAETAEELAARWISEFEEGIAGTDVRPGFIKISVDRDSLSEQHAKLVRAAGLTHLATGLTIMSHTGPQLPAFQQLALLEEMGIAPSAFIWTHAQNERDHAYHLSAARRGCWVAFDGFRADRLEHWMNFLLEMKAQDLLDHVLLSHDAGWYDPAKPGGGNYRGYTDIATHLIPAMRLAGFTEAEMDQLLEVNPAVAFRLQVRTLP